MIYKFFKINIYFSIRINYYYTFLNTFVKYFIYLVFQKKVIYPSV